MKSSAISLSFSSEKLARKYLINVVDSPGHVDFSGEVETALRLCDGALVVVDVVEGVCVQTVAVLRAALEYEIRPVLVINKMDRLVTELKLTPMQALSRVTQVLEQVNVIMGLRLAELSMRRIDGGDEKEPERDEEAGSGYFSPEKGNVCFSSAADRWAFRLEQFAVIHAAKLGLKPEELVGKLWGEHYLRSMKIVEKNQLPEAKREDAKPLFAQLILENIWTVYHAFLGDAASEERQRRIVQQLGLKIHARDLTAKDKLVTLRAVMAEWLPVSRTVLDMVVEKLPSPKEAQRDRLRALWPHPRPDDKEAKDGTVWK